MDETFYKRLDEAIAVAGRHEEELRSHSEVVAVGAGPERRAGLLTGEAAVVVTVRRKLSLDDLKEEGAEPLPTSLEGVVVDVVERGAPVEAPEIVAAQEKAKEVLDRVGAEWLEVPNVTGLGIGYKRSGGEWSLRQIALQVFVAEKLAPEEVRARGLREVPAEIGGVVTDVEERPPMRPVSSASGSRDDRRDPLVGGLTVGVNTKPFSYGTLGAIVFDRSTGSRMVLSNQHVLDGPVGTDVVQPSPIGLDDSLEVGFQLDLCDPVHFFRLDTPNTTLGSVLAGASLAALVAAALSDEIDPTRRGQNATPPPPGAKTTGESHSVKLSYPELPIPGTHFSVDTSWRYTRHTDTGDLSTSASERKTNPHVLADQLMLTDRKSYRPGDTIRLFGMILPEACVPVEPPRPDLPSEVELKELAEAAAVRPPRLSEAISFDHVSQVRSERDTATGAIISRRCRCDRYHATAILTPVKVDRAFPVVLGQPSVKRLPEVIERLVSVLTRYDDQELRRRAARMVYHGCLYYGELPVDDLPGGPWRDYLFVQTVDNTPEGAEPIVAAQTIGGLPISRNTAPQVDLACGPVVLEDGEFDIEFL